LTFVFFCVTITKEFVQYRKYITNFIRFLLLFEHLPRSSLTGSSIKEDGFAIDPFFYRPDWLSFEAM
jgi:hypothetical protein